VARLVGELRHLLFVFPGPVHHRSVLVGSVLLAVVCGSNFLPWRHFPQWTAVLPSLLYVVSAALIITSVGHHPEWNGPDLLGPLTLDCALPAEMAVGGGRHRLHPGHCRPLSSVAGALAAVMVSAPGVLGRRAKYFRIDGDTVSGEWEFDETDSCSASTFPMAEHPYLTEVVRTGQAACGAYDLAAVGPTLRANLLSYGTTHGAWIPISPRGVLPGVLSVSSRGVDSSDELFARAVALGHIVELALSNALTLQKSQRVAATDPLTGLANRRGFDLDVAQLGGRRPFALLAIDVDDLKMVNDSRGHATGDAVLVGIVEAATMIMREETSWSASGEMSSSHF